MGKRKKGGSGDWDRVPIGEEFVGEKEMGELISLEVLTDYELVKTGDGVTEIITGKEKRGQGVKRKHEEEDETDQEEVKEEGEEDERIGKKEVKERNKKKVNKSKEKGGEGKVEEELVKTGEKNKKKNKGKKDKQKQAKKHKESDRLDEEEGSDYENESTDASMEEWVKAGVPEVVLKALKEAGFYEPTAIQALSLPASLLGKKDVVGAAETGSGKTLAFAIPIISGILRRQELIDEDEDQSLLQALILTPTRELAVQIKKHFDVAAKYTNIKTVVIVGGLASQKQERLLKMKPEVVIATPGRLWELVKNGDPHLSNFNQLRFLAVDETDRMVERGHFEELQSILQMLNSDESTKKRRQNFMFSATLSFTHDPPKRLQLKKQKRQPKKLSGNEKLKQLMDLVGVRPNPKIVDITSNKGTCESLQEMQINCPANKKDYYMYYFLIKHPGRTIVFCNSINTVRRLTNLFFLLKCGQVLPLHAEMHQKQRLKNLEKFSADEGSVLIATDVAARGLDIPDIQHVVHYEIPKTAESYIHRSGRTARALKGGIAIVLVEPDEVGKLKNIFRSLNRDPDKMLPLFAIDGTVFRHLKARVDEADKVEKFEHTVRKKLADMNWMDKAKRDMDIVTSDEDSDLDDNSGDGEKRHRKNLLDAKKKLEGYKKSLSKLLSDNSFMTRLGLNP